MINTSRAITPRTPDALGPLADAVIHEQDQCAQLGVALAVVTAVEASAPASDLRHDVGHVPPQYKTWSSAAFVRGHRRDGVPL